MSIWLRGICDKERRTEGKEPETLAYISPIDSDSLGAKGTPMANIVAASGVTSKRGQLHRGIGLLETFWKYLEIIMDKHLSKIEFHDCLYNFLEDRGTVTATMEVKLTHQLAYMDQVPLYGFLLT